MTNFTTGMLQGYGFTGVQVWSASVTDIFKASSTTESFLYISMLNGSEPTMDTTCTHAVVCICNGL